jgi:DNA (cytosine-5)-methyltransferase 1
MSVPRIDASGCGYWPSATATTRECTPEQWEERREQQGGTLRSTYLQDAVKYQVEERTYPTPRVSDGNGPGEHGTGGPDLRTVIARGTSTPQTWHTPAASDNRDRGNMQTPAIRRRQEKGKEIMLSMQANPDGMNGSLNPTWVEWLMGWPRGWTDSGHSVTGKSLTQWLRRGRFWLTRLGY